MFEKFIFYEKIQFLGKNTKTKINRAALKNPKNGIVDCCKTMSNDGNMIVIPRLQSQFMRHPTLIIKALFCSELNISYPIMCGIVPRPNPNIKLYNNMDNKVMFEDNS